MNMNNKNNKNKWLIGGSLCAFLGIAGYAWGQIHHGSGQGSPTEPGGWATPPHYTAALKAKLSKVAKLTTFARAALDAGDYVTEEDYARQLLSMGHSFGGFGQELLAQSLYDQGKDEEALQVYKAIADEGDVFPYNMVPYATLLLKSGQWTQAVNVYNKMQLYFSKDDMMVTHNHFSPDVPEPKELTVALHIAQGEDYQGSWGWGYHSRNEQGMREFAQALQLAPDSPLANYYYGKGWQWLSPKEKAEFGHAAQAKAALQKAAASEDGDIKKAAEDAVKWMP